jgi:filamentous hemagglutinin family protein
MNLLRQTLLATLISTQLLPPHLGALPTGLTLTGTVGRHPALHLSADGKQMTVTVDQSRAILNWNSFSIAADELARFVQPNSASVVLNRVTGGNPSALLGRLEANGGVFVINPNGVLVGAGAVIQTGGTFVASTRDVSDASFLAGGTLNLLGSSSAGVENLGLIKSATGDVILVGRTVKNVGGIEAPQGTAGLAAGDDILLSTSGNDRLSVRLPGAAIATGTTGVDNQGTVKAAQAQLTAAGGHVYALAVSNGGAIEATGFAQRPDGRIVLSADGGDIAVSGNLSARNANGDGGTILLGGGDQGRVASVPNARNLTLSGTVDADATSSTGSGGHVIAWSERTTNFAGNISARGGAAGGDGGFVEVSGKINLGFNGVADLRAPSGRAGSLLLDPTDITIAASTLGAQLQLGNVELITNAAGSEAGDITITGSENIFVSAPNSLTLRAHRDINVLGSVTFSTQSIGSNAPPGTQGVVAYGPGIGAFTFNAGRDINLSQSFAIAGLSTGFETVSGAAQLNGPDVTVGPLTFIAGRHFTSATSFLFSAVSQGAKGDDVVSTTPTAVLPSGGRGGNISVGAISVTAGGDVAFNGSGLFIAGRSIGGTGGRGSGGGTGGAAGNVTLSGLTVTAGGTLRLAGSGSAIQAVSTGGGGGQSVGTSDGTSPLRNGGIGGAAGNVALGNVAFQGLDIDSRGTLDFKLESRGGRGSNAAGSVTPSKVGIGGAAGNVTGGVNFEATRDILSVARTTRINAVTLTQNGDKHSLGDGLGGAGGAPGTATLAATRYRAGRDIASPTITNTIDTTAAISLIAGGNLTLTQSKITTAGILTLVADNAHPSEPASGTGAISLNNTQLIGANGDNSAVRIYGVNPSLVQLGTLFTPARTGTENQYFGDADATLGGVYYKAIFVPVPLRIAANNATVTYGFSALPNFTATISGLTGGDTESVVTGLQFSTTAALGANAGSYTITPFGASAPQKYAISYQTGMLTVSPAQLTVTASNARKTYGAVNPPLAATVTGLINGDSQAGVVAFAPTTSATVASGVGAYAISPGASLNSSNYTLVQANGTLTVDPAPLTVAANNASKVYGAALPTLSATVTGLVNGDTQAGTVTLSPTTAATLGANVGTYDIAPGATLNSGNYTLTQSNGTLTVTAAPLTIRVDDKVRDFGAANPAFTYTLSGLVNGDTGAVLSGVALSTVATTDSPGGTYPITASGGFTLSPNYVANVVPGTLTVGAAGTHPLIIAAQNVSLTYGFAALPTFSATLTGLVGGDAENVVTGLRFTTSARVGANVGTYAITPHSATAPGKYALSYREGTLTITPAALSVAAASVSKVYGAPLPALTTAITGLVNGDASASVVAVSPSTTARAGSNVGTYTIAPNASLLSSNYTLAQSDGTLTVTAAPLTIRADDKTRDFGVANPALTATFSGLVNGDTAAVISGLDLTTTAGPTSPGGGYAITQRGSAAAANYSISFIPGTLTVGARGSRPLTIAANDLSLTYGFAALPAFTASYSGFVDGDTASVVTGLQFSTTARVGANVGTYTITPFGATAPAKYGIVYRDGTLSVRPAALTVAAADATRVYGAADPGFSGIVSGLVNGDSPASVVTFAPTTTATRGSNVGSYFIQPNPTLLTSNYVIDTTNPGLLTVTPALLSIAGNTFSQVYGENGALARVTATGLVNGDTLSTVATIGFGSRSLTGDFVPFDFAAHGVMGYDASTNEFRPWIYDYPVDVELRSANYRLGAVTGGRFSVTPREVTISFTTTNLARSSRGWDVTSVLTANGNAQGNTASAHLASKNNNHQDFFTFTFAGMLGNDLGVSTAQNFTVAPILAYQANRPLPGGGTISGPVITGVSVAPSWHAKDNYTFKWVQPTAADLNFMPTTTVTVGMGDIATVVGNPSLKPVFSFQGSGLGALDGFDLTQNLFGYRTNWRPGSQSGLFWMSPTLPSSIEPGNIPYTPTTSNAPDRVTIPPANGHEAGAYWFSPLLPNTELHITALNPGLVRVYNAAGELNAANNNAQSSFWAERTADARLAREQEADRLGLTGRERTLFLLGGGEGVAVTLLESGYGNPRFNLNSGAVLGYPAYQASEVFDAVALFLSRSGKPSDHASVTNWIRANDNEAGRQAIFPMMTEYIMTIAQSGTRTAGQDALLNTVSEAVRSNRIAAYQEVEASYKAWQDDVRRAKEGKMPTLYSLIDLGEKPPASLVNQLGMAKTGMNAHELRATGAVIGSSIAYATTAAGLAGMAASGVEVGVTGALMPFAKAAATTMAASGPVIAATFVAIVASDAAIKVIEIEKFKNDLESLKKQAYGHASVGDLLKKGNAGTAELLNALRELNGFGG